MNIHDIIRGEPPLVVFPWRAAPDSSELAARLRACAERYLPRLGLILFRGFATRERASFQHFVTCFERCEFRYEFMGREAAPAQRVRPGSPTGRRALAGALPAIRGRPTRSWLCRSGQPGAAGAIEFVDGREVFRLVPERVRRRWCERGLRVAQTYAEGSQRSWSRAFGTGDVARVERRCRELGLAWHWLDARRLRIEKVYSPISRHPLTGARVWSSDARAPGDDPPDAANAVAAADAVDAADGGARAARLTFADGEPIPAAEIALVERAFAEAAQRLEWEPGDTWLFDDALTAHRARPDVAIEMWIAEEWTANDRSASPGGATALI